MTSELADLFVLPSVEALKPKTLSHYTSLDGFLSIIQQSQLRASNILFLNDKEEMSYGIKVARDLLEEVEVRQGTKKPDGRGKHLRLLEELPDVYACCFCAEPDMLSQWRGYGGGGQSVSIQFDTEKLEQLAAGMTFNLRQVLYGRAAAMEMLRKRLQEVDTDIPLVQIIFETLDLKSDDFRREVILDMSPQFKNHAFQEEREWRVIAKASAVKRVEYRVRDNVVVPFITIGAEDSRLPIERVTVGPGKDAALTRKSISNFLAKSEFYRDVDVTISSIPFRT